MKTTTVLYVIATVLSVAGIYCYMSSYQIWPVIVFWAIIFFCVGYLWRGGKVEILRELTWENFFIGARNGLRTIADSKNFFSLIDDSLIQPESGRKVCFPTPPMLVGVFELMREASVKEMFLSLPADPEHICVTEDQLIEISSIYGGSLKENGFIILLFLKKDVTRPVGDDNIYVITLYVGSMGPVLYRYEYDDTPWKEAWVACPM